ncbi:MAG TPA: DUF6544 family protein [Kofleriaceae bacterium]
MALLVVLLALLLVTVIAIVVTAGRLRFQRRLAHEMRALLVVPHGRPGESPTELPAPVERYRQLAVGARAPVHTLILQHHGTFRTSPTAKPAPIRGTQLFSADPPGFVWMGRVRVAPGLWIDARDMSVAGEGSMRVLVDDVIPVVDAHGAQIDQGSLLRLLAEMVWYPTSLFDGRSVTWSAIDEHHARATLETNGHTVSGIFEFGDDGMPLSMTADRYTDKGELRPWGGVYRDWRTVSGMRVPFEAEVTWELASGPCTYAHWQVESMVFDQLPT